MKYVVNIKRSTYDVYIGRSGPWGNPFEIGRDGTREQVIAKFERWFLAQPELVEKAKEELRGKILGCHCAPLPCHGEILYRIANEVT